MGLCPSRSPSTSKRKTSKRINVKTTSTNSGCPLDRSRMFARVQRTMMLDAKHGKHPKEIHVGGKSARTGADGASIGSWFIP